MTADELRACFARAREIGPLNAEALRAARGRVEWRPSLTMLDEVIDEFIGWGTALAWCSRLTGPAVLVSH